MRLHLVDGTFELFRAHYSKRPDHVTPGGLPAKATLGIVYSMLTLLEDPAERVTHVAVAFDNPIRSFRNRLFDGYKTEDGVDPQLLAQFDLAEDAMAALGVTVWSMKEWEADDALATAAARFGDEVEQVRICTPDKDLGQCLKGDRVVLVDRIRNREMNEAWLLKERGLRPQSVPDFLALVGDTADGIPGLDGFGEKSTAALLERYGTLEQIPLDAAKWAPKVRQADKLAANLRDGLADALLYRKLATLVRDVPLKETLADLEYRGARRQPFSVLADGLGKPELKARLTRYQEG